MLQLAERQSPGAMVLSCCDSRTDPAQLFSCESGELFVHRAIAALVAPLHMQDLLVLGHTSCSGISALVQGVADTPQEGWILVAEPVLARARGLCPGADDRRPGAERERLAPVFSLKNPETCPWIARGPADGSLSLHTWLSSLRDGELFACNASGECHHRI